MKRRILLIQTAFIGDAILSTSTLSSLSDLGFECDVLVRKGNEVFYENHPDCSRVLIWNKKGFVGKYKSLISLHKSIRNAKYYAIINLQRFAATGFLTAFSGTNITLGFSQNPFSFAFRHRIKHGVRENFHESERNLELIRLAFPDAKLRSPNLHLNQQIMDSVSHYKQEKYICIFPGSVWFTKRLSNAKWVELIKLLPTDYTVYFLGAPNEIELCSAIIADGSQFHAKLKNLCGKLSLMQSAALGKGAEMNYCNDSSPVHFLSAVNANISAFFLSTAPIFGFYPISKNASIQEVENLACKPCGMVGKANCPEGHFNCDKTLAVRTFLE